MSKFLSFWVLLLFTSCVAIEVVGLTDDSKKLTPEQRNLIFTFSDLASAENGKIYKLDAKQLRAELAKHPSSLVYVFTNGCSSPRCKPMADYIRYAETTGQTLFLVMNGYGNLQQTLDQSPAAPLFVIDAERYESKYRSSYTKAFTQELLGVERHQVEVKGGTLHFFKGDEYLHSKPADFVDSSEAQKGA